MSPDPPLPSRHTGERAATRSRQTLPRFMYRSGGPPRRFLAEPDIEVVVLEVFHDYAVFVDERDGSEVIGLGRGPGRHPDP